VNVLFLDLFFLSDIVLSVLFRDFFHITLDIIAEVCYFANYFVDNRCRLLRHAKLTVLIRAAKHFFMVVGVISVWFKRSTSSVIQIL
jgi:hypothetical protein